jgi:hypothetical protein
MNTAAVIVRAIAALERAAGTLRELGREAEADSATLVFTSGQERRGRPVIRHVTKSCS